MINNWLAALPEEVIKFAALLNENQIGGKISKFDSDLPDLSNVKAALLGVGPLAHHIRRSLYKLQHPFGFEIVDLGNLANDTCHGLTPVVSELLHAGILPLVIGAKEDQVQAIQVVMKNFTKKLHPVFIDEKIAFGEVLERSYLNGLIDAELPLEGVTVLGYQKHISSPTVFNKKNSLPLHTLRLSQVTMDPKAMEPYIRHGNSLTFSLNALKKGEAPIKSGFNPSGLRSEEACLICRYAGINEQMMSLAITGLDMEAEECDQTSTLVGQMIWYFLDGMDNRMSEFPIASQHLIEYVVTASCWDRPLHFYKSMVTGRWWMAHPQHPVDFDRMIPCTYEEYLSACSDELPDRLMTVLY